MLRVFYHFYFSVRDKSFLWTDDFWGRLWSFIMRKTIPYYYRFSIPFQKKGTGKGDLKNEVIVSLTSFPARINIVWLSIESILRQSYKPDRIILWLGKEYFAGIKVLPSVLRNQTERGLKIEFREDLKPHTKYFYLLKESKDSILITVDDDVFYPPDMLEKLIYYHRSYPNTIICHGARKIESTREGFARYQNWKNWHSSEIDRQERFDLLPLGVMGVLYPPRSLNDRIFDVALLKKTSLMADDLWLKAMSIKEGTKILLTNAYPKAFVCTPGSQSESLMTYNVFQDQNDKQMESLNKELNIFQVYQSLIS